MVLKTTPHQDALIEEKLEEALRDPSYSKADKVEMESILDQISQPY